MSKPIEAEQKYANQSVLITGGGSGIGLAIAKRFASMGARTLIVGRSESRLARAVSEIQSINPSGQHLFLAGDVSSETVIKDAVAKANGVAPLTVAVANAGTGGLSPVIATEADHFDDIMRTNLRGTFLVFKHAGRAIAKTGGGAMCGISSIAGTNTHRFMAPYCVSKAAIDMLIRNTADELGIGKVRVNGVNPGLVETELASGLLNDENVYNDYLDCMPVRRHGQVEDIANAVEFLCSPEATWITGVNLAVDGGHHLRRGPNVEPFARALFGDEAIDL
ncbi:SDR family oxidoreductase [Pseudomonadales bacterium]|nr:SDR family oxidoreductase [Pseudomonadales bacterium]